MKPFLSGLIIFLTLIGCGSGGPDRRLPDNRDDTSSRTVSVESFEPAVRETSVPTDAEVRLTFSDRIDWDTVDFFNFRVEDDFGQVVTGEIRLSADERTLTFTPQRGGGQRSVLRSDTTYTVISRYLRDLYGGLIAPFSGQFRTVEGSQTTGDFKAVGTFPRNRWIMPHQSVSIEFNEEIRRPNTGATCDRSYFGTAMQVGVLQVINDDGETRFDPLDGNICIRQHPQTGKETLLEFTPSGGAWPSALVPQGMQIQVSSSSQIAGDVSQQNLERDRTFEKIIYPTPQQLLEAFNLWPIF